MITTLCHLQCLTHIDKVIQKFMSHLYSIPVWQMAMIKCQHIRSHPNDSLVSSPRDAAGSGFFKAGSDICVCHLETTNGTGGGVQGKT